MARMDEPGFVSPLPGLPGFMERDSGLTAPGAQGMLPALHPPDTDPVSVTVTIPGASDANSDTATVGAADVLMANQVAGLAAEPISGVTGLGDSGAGKGTVWPPVEAHPNSMNVSPDGTVWAPQKG